MSKITVSVIMPVFNGADTIKYAIKSLLLQSFQDWECIIINDGSTDNTKQIFNSLKD